MIATAASTVPRPHGRGLGRRVLTGLVTVTVAALTACGSSGGASGGRSAGASTELLGSTHRIVSDPSAARSTAQAEQRFALALLRHMGGTGNASVSPAGLARVLSMLADGASGTTRTEIARTLGSTGLTDAQRDAGWQALDNSWTTAAAHDGLTLSSADAVWVQQGLRVRAPFLNALRTYYGAGVWTTDFGHLPAALAAIDAWTRQHTGGRIPKLFDTLDPSTVLALADAVYLKATWATPFDPADTTDGRFTLGSGSGVTAKFLQNQSVSLPVATGGGVTAVQLPYTGGHFAALALMPTSTSLAGFTAALTATRLAGIVASLRTRDVDLTLPKFSTSTSTQLGSALSAMGMPTAFGPSADFAAMTPTAVTVGQALQRVALSVGEKGTEAAAATGVAIQPSSAGLPGRPLTIDRPFLFLIRDTTTGAILFASRIADPSAG